MKEYIVNLKEEEVERIRNLIPSEVIDIDTRLTVINLLNQLLTQEQNNEKEGD